MHEPRLAWPPPGLESLHGKLWPLITMLALADLVLLLPLLPAAATHQPFWSLGLFGTDWWILLTTTAIGLILFVTALIGLVRLFWTAARAARQGHGWRLILYVAADETRDGGFLLQGARAFSDVPLAQRRTILALRMTAAAAWLAAAALAPAGLTLAIVLAAAGWAGEATMWALALVGPMVLLLVGVACRIADRVLTAAAWHAGKVTVTAEMRAEIGHWSERFGQHPTASEMGLGAGGRSRGFKIAAVTTAILGVLVVAAMALTTAGGAVGAILASVSVPRFSNLHARIAAADVLRGYRLDPNPAISPAAAGEALHALLAAGQAGQDHIAPEKAPARVYQDAWLPEPAPAPLANPFEWLLELFDRARRLSPAERDYLRTVAANPAHREFATVARAGAADIIGTRYQLPMSDTLRPVALPIPRFGRVREGAHAHLATAALALAEGRPAEAEHRVREVISLGFVLMDQGPTLIDNMIGATLVGNGGDALERLFHATGRGRDAEALAWVRAEVKRATDRTAQGTAAGLEEALSAMPGIVMDTTMALGLRWEFLTQVATFASCINLHRMIFGAKDDYAQWLEGARRSLVRRPSDEEMFRFMARGFFGSEGCLPLLGALRG